jgi:hypothetical protein
VLLCGIFITFGRAQTQTCIARGWRSLVAAKGYLRARFCMAAGLNLSGWLKTTIEKLSREMAGGTQTPLKSGLALLEARFEPEKP